MALDDVNRRNFSNEVRGDLNNGNFDNIAAHFNPSFEVSRGTTITIFYDVLDPGKHSAITLKDSAHKKGKDSSARSPRVNFGEGVSVSRERPRGCARDKFPRIFREYNREHSPNIISLLETRVSGSKADNIIAKLGFLNSHCIEAIGFLAGIWIGWKNSIHLEIIFNHPRLILARVGSSGFPNSVILLFVYWSLNKQKRKDLWNILKNLIPMGNSPWAAIGDFNVILSSSEKSKGITKGRRCPLFGDFVDKAEINDLGFRGPSFTWHMGLLFERLDKALGNKAWIQTFPNSLVTHLPKIKSDHRSLLFSLNSKVYLPNGRPFRFLAGWVEHPDFGDFVKDKWDFSGDMSISLSMFTRDFKNWNTTIYGHITSHKRSLIKELTTIQKIMDFSGSNWLAQNLDLLRIWLSEEVIELIMGIPLPCSYAGLDKISWCHTSIGNFTIKSAYKFVRALIRV
ncbi:hypothetical protein V6Z11_A08G094900 [Gossypium hirsutum]